MKLAIASQDGTTMSQHFGHSSCFIIYEIEEDTVKGREVRALAAPAHGATDEPDHAPQAHGHDGLLQALEGCDALLCGGIGSRAAEDLRAHRINTLVTLDTDLDPDEAVQRLLSGKLRPGRVHACCCNHDH